MKTCALLLILLGAASAVELGAPVQLVSKGYAHTSEADLLKDAELHKDQFPDWLANNITIENLKTFMMAPPALLGAAPAPPSEKEFNFPEEDFSANTTDGLLKGGVDPATLMQIGKILWAVVKEGKPIANIQSAWSGAIPKNQPLESMFGWRDMYERDNGRFHWSGKNPFGAKLFDFTWGWSWKGMGQFNEKPGNLYVTNVQPAVSNVYVMWGWGMDVSVRAANALNYGTSAGRVNAGIDIEVTMKAESWFQTEIRKCTMTMKATGSWRYFSCG